MRVEMPRKTAKAINTKLKTVVLQGRWRRGAVTDLSFAERLPEAWGSSAAMCANDESRKKLIPYIEIHLPQSQPDQADTATATSSHSAKNALTTSAKQFLDATTTVLIVRIVAESRKNAQ